MDSIKKGFLISFYNIKKWIMNPRMYIILILCVLYSRFTLEPIQKFCTTVGIGITPFVFPFLMADKYSRMIVLFLVILLFCDAPFVDTSHPYMILRSGRKKWFAGQILYIFTASALFSLVLVFVSNLVLVPSIELHSGWGKVINTFAQTNAAADYGIPLGFDSFIVANYTPFTAMFLQGGLCILVFSLLGNLMFLLNALFSRTAGMIGATALILFQMIARDIAPVMTYFSPAAWISLSALDSKGISDYPSVQYAIIMLCIFNVVLVFLSYLVIRKKDVAVLKSI